MFRLTNEIQRAAAVRKAAAAPLYIPAKEKLFAALLLLKTQALLVSKGVCAVLQSVWVLLGVAAFGVCAGAVAGLAGFAAKNEIRFRELRKRAGEFRQMNLWYLLFPVLGGALAVACVLRFENLLACLLWCCFFAVLLTVTFVDITMMEIPDGCCEVVAALALAMLCSGQQGLSPWDRLIGFAAGLLPFLLIGLLIHGSFGGGDIKLMGACGLFLGWKLTLLSSLIGILLGGIWGAFLLVSKRKGAKEHFAFGPCLCAGMTLCAFFGDELIQLYLTLFDFSRYF